MERLRREAREETVRMVMGLTGEEAHLKPATIRLGTGEPIIIGADELARRLDLAERCGRIAMVEAVIRQAVDAYDQQIRARSPRRRWWHRAASEATEPTESQRLELGLRAELEAERAAALALLERPSRGSEPEREVLREPRAAEQALRRVLPGMLRGETSAVIRAVLGALHAEQGLPGAGEAIPEQQIELAREVARRLPPQMAWPTTLHLARLDLRTANASLRSHGCETLTHMPSSPHAGRTGSLRDVLAGRPSSDAG